MNEPKGLEPRDKDPWSCHLVASQLSGLGVCRVLKAEGTLRFTPMRLTPLIGVGQLVYGLLAWRLQETQLGGLAVDRMPVL